MKKPDRYRKYKIVLASFVGLALTIILLLIGELALVLKRNSAISSAEDYRKHNKNIFEISQLNEAADGTDARSVWETHWVQYRPNATVEMSHGQETYEIRINSHGFRTREFDIPRPAGVFRVICIGGSTTMEGKTNDKTYPVALERQLRERFPGMNIEVLNFGISGTQSSYWPQRIQRLFRYQPNLIVQYNAVNDICWSHLPHYGSRHPWRAVLNKSLLLQRLIPLNPDDFDSYFDGSFRNFSRLKEEASQRGVEYLVGSFASPDYAEAVPAFRSYLDVQVEQNWGGGLLRDYSGYRSLLTRFNELLAAWAAKNDVNLAKIDEQMSDPDLFTDICHSTEEGIERKAAVFADAVAGIIERTIKDQAGVIEE